MPCDIVSWLKARRIVKQTDRKVLETHSNDILECFGGIQGILEIIFKTHHNIDSLQAIKFTNILTEINITKKRKNKLIKIQKKRRKMKTFKSFKIQKLI